MWGGRYRSGGGREEGAEGRVMGTSGCCDGRGGDAAGSEGVGCCGARGGGVGGGGGVGSTAGRRGVWEANRLGLEYREEAALLGRPVVPVFDCHTHVNGPRSAEVFLEACDLYGVTSTSSQTLPGAAADVKRVMGDRVRFVAVPDYGSPDRVHAHTEGFLDNIRMYHAEYGSRLVKFWNAPRLRDFAGEGGDPGFFLTRRFPDQVA